MTDLPLQLRLDPYQELKENLRRKVTEHNVDHLHTLIANDPDDPTELPLL